MLFKIFVVGLFNILQQIQQCKSCLGFEQRFLILFYTKEMESNFCCYLAIEPVRSFHTSGGFLMKNRVTNSESVRRHRMIQLKIH